MKKSIITVSREFGSGGRTIGKTVAQRLGIPYYDKELVKQVALESGFDPKYIEEQGEFSPGKTHFAFSFLGRGVPGVMGGMTAADFLWTIQHNVIRDLADKGPCVIVGRCADYILRDDPRRLSVFVHAPLDERVRRAREEYGVQEPNLESFVLRQDKARASYYNYFATGKWGQSREYDLCVSSHMGIAAAVATIKAAALAVAGGTGA